MQPHLQTTFCDDIRQEIGGKYSCIGIYTGRLLVREFPVTLPKLCLAGQIVLPLSCEFSELRIVVTLGDSELATETQPAELITAMRELRDKTPGDQIAKRVFVVRLMLEFSPLELTGPGEIKVRAYLDQDEVRGLGLAIGIAPEENGECSD